MSIVASTSTKLRPVQVGLGQIALARAPDKLVTVLGSCVGVALWHPRMNAGALAHVVLPESNGQTETPGKFADTALPRMIALLAEQGVGAAGLIAKIAGGASMFGKEGPLQVGQANIEAVKQALVAARIRSVGEHLGENKGRRVTLDCATGELLVEIGGRESVVL